MDALLRFFGDLGALLWHSEATLREMVVLDPQEPTDHSILEATIIGHTILIICYSLVVLDLQWLLETIYYTNAIYYTKVISISLV